MTGLLAALVAVVVLLVSAEADAVPAKKAGGFVRFWTKKLARAEGLHERARDVNVASKRLNPFQRRVLRKRQALLMPEPNPLKIPHQRRARGGGQL